MQGKGARAWGLMSFEEAKWRLLEQYCLCGVRRSISVDMFAKTMDLDLRWHLMRKTGEVTRIMDRGTSAIQNVLSTGAVC